MNRVILVTRPNHDRQTQYLYVVCGELIKEIKTLGEHTVTDPSRSTTPNKDKNFKPFREVYISIVVNLLSGFTVSQTVERTKEHIRHLIRDYGVLGIRDKYGDAPLIRFALFWDMIYLKCHGNSNAAM